MVFFSKIRFLQIFDFIRFVPDFFTKLIISQKLIEIILLYKKYLIVYTLSFERRVNVNFCNKKMLDPSTPLLYNKLLKLK